MPLGKKYDKNKRAWVEIEKERALDYEQYGDEGAALLISYWRWYPDKFLDLCEADNPKYRLAPIQRMNMRVSSRYTDTFLTGSRGLTKSYVELTNAAVQGILFPGVQRAYVGPTNKQTVGILSQVWREICGNFPGLTSMWEIVSDSADRFEIKTKFGSKISVAVARGDTIHGVTAEEVAQEESGKAFDHDEFEKVVLAAVRATRTINAKEDSTFPQNQHHYVTSAGTQQNPSFDMRVNTYRKMREGKSAFAIDIPFEVAILSGIRKYSWAQELKDALTPDVWLREMLSIWTGTSENPVIRDLTLTQSKTISCMEFQHCGDPQCVYVIGQDNSYRDGTNNAKCAYSVIKCTPQNGVWDNSLFKKDIVYVQDMDPPKSAAEQARIVKDYWRRYTMRNSSPAYIAIDSRAYGTAIIEMLHSDLQDGMPPLCCINHDYPELEVKGAIPVLYPIVATGGITGSHDSDSGMLEYAEREWEHGNVRMLVSNIQDGIKAYKTEHRIKTDEMDGAIAYPYLKTRELCGQIANLKKKNGVYGYNEVRISKSIQRDMWSATKYGLRVCRLLKDERRADANRGDNQWEQWARQQMQTGGAINGLVNGPVYGRARCIGRIGGNNR